MEMPFDFVADVTCRWGRVERGQRLEPVLGHHAAGARVVVAIPVEMREFKGEAEARGGLLEHAQALGHDLLPYAVAGNHRNAMRGHRKSSSCSIIGFAS